jgi:hypothetical protein
VLRVFRVLVRARVRVSRVFRVRVRVKVFRVFRGRGPRGGGY